MPPHLWSDPFLTLMLDLETSRLKLISSYNSLIHCLLSYFEAVENLSEHYLGEQSKAKLVREI